MENDFLHLSDWWGDSDKPGQRDMFLHPDGVYTLKVVYSFPKDQKDNVESGGKIEDEARLQEINNFLKTNIIESTKIMMFDAGFKVEYNNNGEIITIENNLDLFNNLKKLLPEFGK